MSRQSQSDSTEEMVLALQVVDPGLFPGTPTGLPSTARSDPWSVDLGVTRVLGSVASQKHPTQSKANQSEQAGKATRFY